MSKRTKDRILGTGMPAGMPAYNSKKPITEPDKAVEAPGPDNALPAAGEAATVLQHREQSAGRNSRTEQPDRTAGQSGKAGTEPEEGFYARFFKQNNPDGPLTAEEQAAAEKRRKRNAVIAAVGDGISALSNLYFATKGAPSSFNAKESMSNKMYERYEKLRKEREAKDKLWLNGYMQAQRLDELSSKARHDAQLRKEAQDQKVREFEYKKQHDAALQQIAQEKNRILEEYNKGRLSKEEADRKIREMNARANMLRAQNSSNGQTTTVEIERNELGQETKRTVTKGQGKDNVPPSRRGNVDNVPPSRRNKNDNTPPSRRK